METPPKPAIAPSRVINVHGSPQEFHGEFAADLPGKRLAAGGKPGAFPETLPGDFAGNCLCFRPLSLRRISSHLISVPLISFPFLLCPFPFPSRGISWEGLANSAKFGPSRAASISVHGLLAGRAFSPIYKMLGPYV